MFNIVAQAVSLVRHFFALECNKGIVRQPVFAAGAERRGLPVVLAFDGWGESA
jgi:hypothetical protein